MLAGMLQLYCLPGDEDERVVLEDLGRAGAGVRYWGGWGNLSRALGTMGFVQEGEGQRSQVDGC